MNWIVRATYLFFCWTHIMTLFSQSSYSPLQLSHAKPFPTRLHTLLRPLLGQGLSHLELFPPPFSGPGVLYNLGWVWRTGEDWPRGMVIYFPAIWRRKMDGWNICWPVTAEVLTDMHNLKWRKHRHLWFGLNLAAWVWMLALFNIIFKFNILVGVSMHPISGNCISDSYCTAVPDF